jgi:hypothetical protein
MLHNKQTNGYLVCDMSDRITSHDEAYACTTTDKPIGPCARSVYVITKVEDDGFKDNIVRYGQKIRIEANPYILNKPLYLHSCMISPLFFARFSRNQEVCLSAKSVYNTVWRILHSNPNHRNNTLSEPVKADHHVMIEHCATSQYLASDKIDYRSDFGMEFEVSVASYSSNNKSQALNLEKVGKLTVDQPTKLNFDQNVWTIVTAPDPSFSEPVKQAPKYNAQDLINDIKQKLSARGTLAIRGLGRMFRILDNNGNRQLDLNELIWGLKDFGIGLDEEQAKVVLEYFDRDRSGTVNFDEFLRALRVTLIYMLSFIG